MPPRILKRSLSVALLLLAALSSGCQHIKLFPWTKHSEIPSASPEHPVVDVVCLWEPAEGTGLDGLPCRGFAGQILFFASGIESPVRVEGPVRIYVFDDKGTVEEQEKPIHYFDFDSEVFQHFLVSTNLGGAYQLFIPYTRPGMERATCALRVRLTPPYGSPVYSRMASVILPGTTPREPDKPIETASTQETPAKSMGESIEPRPSVGMTVAPDASPATATADLSRLKAILEEEWKKGVTRSDATPDQPEQSAAREPLRLRRLDSEDTAPAKKAAEANPIESQSQVPPQPSHHPLTAD